MVWVEELGGDGELGWELSSVLTSWIEVQKIVPGWLLSDKIATAVVAIRVGVQMDDLLTSVDLEWKIADIREWIVE